MFATRGIECSTFKCPFLRILDGFQIPSDSGTK
jgi:hypothetical protein